MSNKEKPGVSELSLFHVKPGCTLCDELWTLDMLLHYTKTDGKLYYISNEVDEVEVSSSGGGGTGTAIAMSLVFGSTFS